MRHKGTGEKPKDSDLSDAQRRKAALDLFEMGQEGYTPRDKGQLEKQGEKYPYSYGLGFTTRTRLFLRTLNLRKAKRIMIVGTFVWFALMLLISRSVSGTPDYINRLLFIPPLFIVGCLGFLSLYRGEYPDDSYNGPSTKRGWFAIIQGLVFVIYGFGLGIILILQIIQALSLP